VSHDFIPEKQMMLLGFFCCKKSEEKRCELSEVGNGGHDQYFYNMENTCDLKKEMAALNTILPIKLKNNLDKAYEVYLLLKEKEGDEKSKEILEQCDDVIYENEETLNYILREYANKIEL